MKKIIAAFKRMRDAVTAYVVSHWINVDASNDETCSQVRYEQQGGQK